MGSDGVWISNFREHYPMLLSDIMTPEVEFVRPDDTLVQAATKMKNLDVGPLPVCEHQGVVGIVTDRDITIRAVALGKDPKTTKVRDVMSDDVICCYVDQEVDVAARLMQSQQIRRVLVVDRDKRLVGIVSLGDLAVVAETPAQAGKILQEVSGAQDQPT
jgi:CBS domain-containing protein